MLSRDLGLSGAGGVGGEETVVVAGPGALCCLEGLTSIWGGRGIR